MAGETGLDSDCERLGVAHLSNHHDVRVLSKEGSHNLGEGHSLGDLDLGDVLIVFVLDRVFDGDDVLVLRV